MGILSKNYVCNSAQVIYHIAYTLGTFLHFLIKTDSKVFLTNGHTDFRPDFADFRNFSGPYDRHTYLPPQKKHGNGRTDPAALKKPQTDTDSI